MRVAIVVSRNQNLYRGLHKMALPTMTGYWSSRKNVYEQAIARHRQQEHDFRRQWSDTANYFKNSDVWATKQNAWSSNQACQDSMDAYNVGVEKEEKAANLRRRREKLASLLSRDNITFEAELTGKSRPSFQKLEEMRSKVDGLKTAREEARQKLAEEKLYQHWQQSNPDLRKVESEVLQDHVVASWSDQLEEKKERLESARQEKLAFEKQLEEDRLNEIKMNELKEAERVQEKKSFKEVLQQQMMEFKKREAEAQEFRRQQEDLLKHKWELDQIEEEQDFKEKERQKKDLGRALLRQHKAQMMRKSQVIQIELENDKKLLESLIAKENEHVALQSARQEKARADAHWMKQVIEDQLRLEKSREAELDMLYQDEAARVWHKRQAEWEKEREARQRLMAEVLLSRQEQVTARLRDLERQQEESLQHREELVKEMELVQQMTQREDDENRRNKMTTKTDLEKQIQTRQEQEKHLKEQLNLKLEVDKEEEEDYEDLLRQETERLRLRGYTPRRV